MYLLQACDSHDDTYGQRRNVVEVEVVKEGERTSGESDIGYGEADDYADSSNNLQNPAALAINRETEYFSYGVADTGGHNEIEKRNKTPEACPGNAEGKGAPQSHPHGFEVLLRTDFKGR